MDYLHNHNNFADLLRILEEETNILSGLIEKDYWIMHVLYGLKKQGFEFELKGGTSLSKGFKIIDRFSEDIDIHIKPPARLNVDSNPKKIKTQSFESRKNYYDWLAKEIKIDGIVSVERDLAFDSDYYRGGGIRLIYPPTTNVIEGVKEGILLEVGFDTVTPNKSIPISSWALDKAKETTGLSIIDNTANDILCYNPGYTLIEKLQTIVRKFRQEINDGKEMPNYMRQYYDIYCLLGNDEIVSFIGTPEYCSHKAERLKGLDGAVPISENEAFKLSSTSLREKFKTRYTNTSKLYYKGQPDFEEVLGRINKFIDSL